MRKPRIGICPICEERRCLTTHHVNGRGMPKQYVCFDCHMKHNKKMMKSGKRPLGWIEKEYEEKDWTAVENRKIRFRRDDRP